LFVWLLGDGFEYAGGLGVGDGDGGLEAEAGPEALGFGVAVDDPEGDVLGACLGELLQEAADEGGSYASVSVVGFDPHGGDGSDGGGFLVCACDGSAGDVADGCVVVLGDDGPAAWAGDLVEGLVPEGGGLGVSPPDAWVGVCEVPL